MIYIKVISWVSPIYIQLSNYFVNILAFLKELTALLKTYTEPAWKLPEDTLKDHAKMMSENIPVHKVRWWPQQRNDESVIQWISAS